MEGSEVVVAEKVVMASGFWQRLIGLMAGGLQDFDGLLLKPCNGVHTMFLREPIDVVVLDRSGKVLRCLRSVKPFRIVWPLYGGNVTVELHAGSVDRSHLDVGQIVSFRHMTTKAN